MKIPRPGPGRIVLVHGGGRHHGPDVAVVIELLNPAGDPLAVSVVPLGVPDTAPLHVHYLGGLQWWRYPPREDRMVDVPDEESGRG